MRRMRTTEETETKWRREPRKYLQKKVLNASWLAGQLASLNASYVEHSLTVCSCNIFQVSNVKMVWDKD